MKTLLMAGACALAAVSLSGCALLSAKPADLAPAIDALGRAGCTFNFSISGGAATAAGLSPGAGHAENTLTGGCNPALAHPAEATTAPGVIPLSQLGAFLSWQASQLPPPAPLTPGQIVVPK